MYTILPLCLLLKTILTLSKGFLRFTKAKNATHFQRAQSDTTFVQIYSQDYQFSKLSTTFKTVDYSWELWGELKNVVFSCIHIKININLCLERFLKWPSVVIIYNQTKHVMNIYYIPIIVLSILSTLSHPDTVTI